MSQDSRRLAAIVFTDMVGYTALSQRDESRALQLLEKHNALLRSVLGQHKCKEVKTIGDAFLLEFESAQEAVLCAIDVQLALREHNKTAQEREKIAVRIGIHSGDVVHRGGDVFGDVVNIASRIVGFADQGGICISEDVYAQVRNKVSYQLVKLPEQKLKNVEREMDLYQIILSVPGEASRAKIPSANTRIAILPFANISPDPNDSYFADGLTEELITTLSEIQGLRVIARTSVNRYRGTTEGVAEIGQKLNVSFILEGSVRKAGNKIRITAQLIDVLTQEQVWASHYDRDFDDLFLIQSDIARQVADSLRVALLAGERVRIEKRDTESLTAYAAYLKGRTFLHDRTESAIKNAREQFELALSEDPKYARAYAGLADTNMILGDYLFAPVPQSLEQAKTYIKKALELDPDIAEARVSLANSLVYDYKFLEAEEEFRRAISLNPSYATAHHWYASCLDHLGRGQEALAELMLAEELDPLSSAITMSTIYSCVNLEKDDEVTKRLRKLSEIDPGNPFVNEANMVYHFAKKEWGEALHYLAKMKDLDPSDPYVDSDIAYIYAVTGRRDEALKLIEKLKELPESSGTRSTLIAFVYAGLNDLEECFRWLEAAFESREVFFGWFRQYPLLENVRKDSRFDQLLRRANLLA